MKNFDTDLTVSLVSTQNYIKLEIAFSISLDFDATLSM